MQTRHAPLPCRMCYREILTGQYPFYEWRKTAKPKLPFAIAMKDDRPFTFAGLWENWKDLETGEWIRTCTIITGEPNELVAQIHPRMPMIIPEQHRAAWLGEQMTVT